MVPFAGYDMPVQYPAGVLKEHLHTRASAGLFDVSHMGQIALRPKSGKVEDAALALERLVPQDIVAVAPGRQRYAQFTNAAGGILDDLMVANFGDHLFLVVNAACKADDEAHLRAHLAGRLHRSSALADRALIALQGPKAAVGAGETLLPKRRAMRFMDAGPRRVDGARLLRLALRLHRRGRFRDFGSGRAGRSAGRNALLDDPDVMPIGLGARDSLRLEAGLCLYGHDIDATTTPVEAALDWSIAEEPAQRRRACRRFSRRRRDPRPIRAGAAAPPRRAEARRPRAGARRRAAVRRRKLAPIRSAASPRAVSGRA